MIAIASFIDVLIEDATNQTWIVNLFAGLDESILSYSAFLAMYAELWLTQ